MCTIIQNIQKEVVYYETMDRLIDRYPYKKILYLNWYQAAIGHLLLFKYYVEKYSQNVYFLISQQGIMLKAVTLDYLKKVDDQITKFFTAKIQQLDMTGSTSFYNNILEDIKEQTQKLKDSRDCPYINLVYSEKLRNSCVAMKKLGYSKPYQNWEYHERQKKGFCFLIVRPEHRWKQIASNVSTLARKRESSIQKNNSEMLWPVQISYEKFIWFYLKQSFKTFKKSLEIKENKLQRCLTIIIKKDIQELTDLQKQIETLTFFYRPTKPKIRASEVGSSKILILSPLQIQKITELVYHQFGLTSFAKQLRKKMTGYLIIGSLDAIQYYESQPTTSPRLQSASSMVRNFLEQRQELTKITNKSKISILLKLGRRHHIVSMDGSNYIQMKIQKPLQKTQYEQILKLRLPCIPRYYYWYQSTQNIVFLLRQYYPEKFMQCFLKSNAYSQIFMISSLLNIVLELHQKDVYLGSCLYITHNAHNSKGSNSSIKKGNEVYTVEQLKKLQFGQIYIDGSSQNNFYHRIIVEPGLTGTKQQDIYRLGKIINILMPLIKDQQYRQQVIGLWNQNQDIFGCFIQNLDEYLESKA